jgi:GntR family transcriptional repressor for pyruvate dehydrogenase complex
VLKVIDRPKLRDVVIDRLKAYIVDEKLAPGDRLPTESELAEMFGVSRLSLREATKSLEFLGIIDAKPGRGLTVGHVNLERMSECMGLHPALHDVAPGVLIDTRIVIETGVLPHVAEKMKRDKSLYAKLNGINAQLQSASTLEDWVTLDLAFHRELISSSGLLPLMAFADVLSVFFQRFRDSVQRAEWSRGIESHQKLIDALKSNRVSEAERLLRNHIEAHREHVKVS